MHSTDGKSLSVILCCPILAKAVVVITANEAVRGTAVFSLKKNVDAALEQGCTQVRRVLVAHRTDTKVPMTNGRDFSLEDVSRAW